MIDLTWGQVNTWRLSQHHLTQRFQPEDLVQAAGQTLGIHAQVMSAAEMAIAARVDELSPQDVQSALWQQRSLIKTWLMRLTLHLVPAADFPVYIAARQLTDLNWPSFLEQNGMDISLLDEYLAVAPEILAGGPLTRQQFADQVSERLKSASFHDYLLKGAWGTAFKPLALHGELCFGPNLGTKTTFISPRAWIGPWQPLEPRAAMQTLLRRYLSMYGPTRPRNFQVWWWMSGESAKQAFNSIADEIEPVNIEGWRATALKSTIEPMLEAEPSGKVNLLPAFDVFTVGSARGKDLERLLSRERQKKVYRPQGWVSAVVLVDGFIKGTWEYQTQRSSVAIKVNLFSSITEKIKEGIVAEAERMAKFLNSQALIEFTQE